MTTSGACDYCGLPLVGAAAPDARRGADSGPRYCCLGCRFAASITASRGADGEARWMMTRLGLALFFTMNVMVFTLLLWSQQEGAAADTSPGSRSFYDLARHACLLFTGPVLLLLGGPLVEDALSDLRRGRLGIGLLLLLGVAAAFGQSAWATWLGSGHVYFEVACMVLVAVTLGRWLEASGKLRTTQALRDLRKLLPDTVRLVTADGEAEVPLEGVRPGNVLRLLPGEHVPTDGRIAAGTAAIDERTVTGESLPVVKGPGDLLHSGTLDLDGELLVEVTAAPGAGTLERLIDAVAAAASGGSRQQRVAERVAAGFRLVVLVVAAGRCAIHWRLHGMAAGVLSGLQFMIAPTDRQGNGADPARRPQIVSNSWQRNAREVPLERAVTALEAAGVLPVFAVGNNGPACGSAKTPGTSDDRLLSVGASDRAGGVASFSGRGPAPGGGADPDVVAPGAGLVSSIPARGYAASDGTSMAAPAVAGTAALVMQANPALVGRLEEVVAIIRRTAVPAGDGACGTTTGGRRNNTGGYGVVNADAAVRAAQRGS